MSESKEGESSCCATAEMCNEIGDSLRAVLDRVRRASEVRSSQYSGAAASKLPRLVAVSKTKPSAMIVEAYRSGQVHFGENYVHELVEKSGDSLVVDNAPDLRWHFIGHVQRNKCKALVSCRNLWMVETVDSDRLALALEAAWKSRQSGHPLRVMVQVNTSREANKHGVLPEACSSLAGLILKDCPNLLFSGLMTIGSVQNSQASETPNPDFLTLVECRRSVCTEHGLVEEDVELSMGMSSDFEEAIALGSTNVRVGSAIFGGRPPTKTT